MNEEKLLKLAGEFFNRNIYPPDSGRITEIREFDEIDQKVLSRIPIWYRNLITRFPIVDLEIGLPNDHGDENLKETSFEELPLWAFTSCQ